jgi:imidazoleglycerol phosphate dehydratase HisB
MDQGFQVDLEKKAVEITTGIFFMNHLFDK